MSFETYLLGLTLFAFVLAMIHALVTGRFGPRDDAATRRGDPVGYAFYVALLIVLIAISVRMLATGALEVERGSLPLLLFPPFFLYSLVETLRTGKVRFLGKEPFSRADRPAPYWTVAAMQLGILLASTWGLIESGLLTAF